MARRVRTCVGLMAVAIAILALPAAASASSVSSTGTTISYTAAGGESNNFSIAFDGITTYTITDPAVPISPSGGCAGGGVAGVPATCVVGGLTSVNVSLGDEADQTGSFVAVDPAVSFTIDGGTGADSPLNGGDGADIMTGGDGADQIGGGNGADTMNGNADGDTINGGNGGDSIGGDGGDDTIEGSFDDDPSLLGGAGDDDIDGGIGSDTADGGGDVDVITGAGGNDTLSGGAGDDASPGGSVQGGAGDDTLNGNAGNDTLDGGADTDLVNFAGAPDPGGGLAVTANLQTGTAGGDGSDTLANFENAAGSDFRDELTGNNGDNTLVGGSGDDTLRGRGGDDTLGGGLGSDTVAYDNAGGGAVINLGSGSTTAFGDGDLATDTYSSVENATGSGNNDTILGDNDANELRGGGGNDTILGNGGNDTLDGGVGGTDTASFALMASPGPGVNATLGSPGSATGDGTDSLAEFENLDGSDNADDLTGDTGPNVFTARAGDDTLEGRLGDDSYQGGTGLDRAEFTTSASPVNVNFVTETVSGEGSDTLNLIELADGSPQADTFTGGPGDDTFNGGNGADTANGAGGSDQLFGENGDDNLTGGSGMDFLRGDSDQDVVNARDGAADDVRCGDEVDTAVIDSPGTDDLTVGDCELTDGPGVPGAPSIAASNPASPADDNAPEITGSSTAGTTVRLYATADCSGAPLASGTAASFASPGLTVNVADNSATELRATASDFDGPSACSAPFTYTELTSGGGGTGGDGGGTGNGGGTGGGGGTTSDTDPPETRVTKTKVKGDDATIKFTSDEAGSTFQCRVDKKRFKPCTSPRKLKNLDDGKHRFQVIATDPAGNADPSAAKAKLKVDD